jgi:hypothetical protein
MQWFSMLVDVIIWRKIHMCHQAQFVVGIHGSMSGWPLKKRWTLSVFGVVIYLADSA